MARAGYWNHNVHYQPVILRAVPPGCGAALEVGCGDGLLASRLVERCAEVTAIDRDPRMTALARSRAEAAGPGRMTVVEADYLAYPVADASFDFACANTSLHHMDFAAALAAMARALQPGGRLAVVGLAAVPLLAALAQTARLARSPGRRRRRLPRPPPHPRR
jgi:ubiquinone/menaquinone biosynthesis C-methylase UbiE